jgi:hypothetical protein
MTIFYVAALSIATRIIFIGCVGIEYKQKIRLVIKRDFYIIGFL